VGEEKTVQRPLWKRLAAAATVLALAGPLWASEMQMKKKEDPQAGEQQKQEEAKKKPPMTKPGCPTDPNASFNTLEDMFSGQVSLELLAAETPAQPDQQAQPTAAVLAPVIQWRAIEPEKEKEPEKKSD
jgi:hypothetical protein